MLAKMDLANREYHLTYDNALTNLRSSLAITSEMELESALAAFKPRPKLVEVFQLLIAERDRRSSLDRKILAKIHAAVEKALPATVIDAQGFHPVPDDPIEAFAFVGTRYAYRTTKRMIDELRQKGYDDPGILDLAIAVADANLWARIYRLAGLKPELFYLKSGLKAIAAAALNDFRLYDKSNPDRIPEIIILNRQSQDTLTKPAKFL